MILSAAACRSSASRENLCTAHPLVFTCPLERLGLRPDLEEKRRDAHELPLAAWREKCSLIIISLWAPHCMSTRRICTSSLQDKREMERVRWGGQCCNKDDKTGLASFSFLSWKIRSGTCRYKRSVVPKRPSSSSLTTITLRPNYPYCNTTTVGQTRGFLYSRYLSLLHYPTSLTLLGSRSESDTCTL